MASIVAALVSFAIALCLGWVLSKAYFRAQTMASLVPRKKHEEMRERYRRRLMIMHKLVKRHEETQAKIKSILQNITGARNDRSQAPVGEDTQGELSGLLNQISADNDELAELEAEIEPLDENLSEEMQRASATENEIQLLRIERDELAAKLARMQAEPLSATERAAAQSDAEQLAANLRAELGAVRVELSSRERQVKDLERRLDDSDAQHHELRAALDSWKQRVNPLTEKLKQQRKVIRELRDEITQDA